MSHLVCLEKRRYPDLRSAVAAVRDLWKDRPVRVEAETAQEWYLRVGHGWPMAPFPDPGAEAVARELLGVDAAGADAFRRLEWWGDRPYLLCLSHCWALWAWSQAVRDLTRDALTLVHLDAHTDLEVPALVCTAAPGRFAAPVGPAHLDLRAPDSVADVVARGFVGIGSFIVPLVYTNRDCDVVHVTPPTAPLRGAHVRHLRPCRLPHHSLAGCHERPAVATDGRGGQLYLCTDDVADLTRLEPRGGVLLDIDMDYFCNRFEAGDGGPVPDEAGRAGAPEPAAWGDSWPGVAGAIDRVAVCLRGAAWRDRVIAITVALSPGFFPSEYWAPALSRLEGSPRSLYGGETS